MFRLIKLIFPVVWVVALIFLRLDAYAQVPAYVPADGLVAWYPFNGNAIDESGGLVNDDAMNSSELRIARVWRNQAYRVVRIAATF